MSMQDPLADMLTRIRNAHQARKDQVQVQSSGLKLAVLAVLKDEGYIGGFEIVGDVKKTIHVSLKYFEGAPAIKKIKRISTPGLRVYKGKGELPRVMGGLGVAVISTSEGVVSDRVARKLGLGGEVLCEIE